MKLKIRITALLLLIAMLCTMLTSCVVVEIIELVNNVWGLVFPEDENSGSNVEINFEIPDPNRCTTHAIVPLPAIAPTCQTPGVSGGQVCSKCGTVIVAQIELPAIDHTYNDVNDKDCNVCGFIRTVKCDHLHTFVLEEKAPTCTTTGRTAGERCTGCGKVIAGFEIIVPTDHSYDDDRDDTCNECGYKRKLACLHEVTKKLDAVSPTCFSTGLTRGKACVHCGEVLVAQQEIPMIEHNEGDWIVDVAPTESTEGAIHTECTMCKATLNCATLPVTDSNADKNASEGLSFVLNDDKNSYSLVDLGSCTDIEIIIPTYYNGLPVTKIGNGAFLNKSTIVSVTIPEGVLNIGDGAFRECTSLRSASIPSTITTIGEYAFYNCALTSLTLPEGIAEIEQYAFWGCDITSIDIPYGVVSIGEGAFEECTEAKSISLPSSLENIGKKAFYNASKVMTVTVPKSVITVGERAFNLAASDGAVREFTLFNYVEKIGAYAFTTGATVYYKGTKAEWNGILIDPRNYQYSVVTLDGSFVD